MGVMMDTQLAVITPTTAARGSTPMRIQAEVTSGMKMVRVARLDINRVMKIGVNDKKSVGSVKANMVVRINVIVSSF